MIKRIALATALMLCICCTLIPSCRVAPSNGDFDAQWQLMTIEYPDGTTEVPATRTYYSFYRHTANIALYGGSMLIANMTYVEDQSVTLVFPQYTPEQLKPFSLPVPSDAVDGVKGVTVTFTINHLSSSKLVMTAANGAVYSLRKY